MQQLCSSAWASLHFLLTVSSAVVFVHGGNSVHVVEVPTKFDIYHLDETNGSR